MSDPAKPPRRFQFGIGTLLLLTALVAVGLGWWVDHRARQEQNLGLSEALTESNRNLEEVSQEAALQTQARTNAEELLELIRLLDPNDRRQARIARELARMPVDRSRQGEFVVESLYERYTVREDDGTKMEIVIFYDELSYCAANPADTLVLLLVQPVPERPSQILGPRFVDALEESTPGLNFDATHTVSFEDRNGDGEREVVFDFEVSQDGSPPTPRTEMYRPTPEGFVELPPPAEETTAGESEDVSAAAPE